MKDAKTVYQQSLEHQKAQNAQELEKIGQLICEMAMQGETSLKIKGRLNEGIKADLRANGYELKEPGTILSRYTIISWSQTQMDL
jgi:hypothetical protein